jgi:hypothetical protein
MATNEKNTFKVVKDEHGDDYLCPVDTVKDDKVVTDKELDDCVEKDVAGRYAGNIDIKPS